MSDELETDETDASPKRDGKGKGKNCPEKELIDKKKLFPAIEMAVNIMKWAHVNKESSDEDLGLGEEVGETESERTLFRDKLQEKLTELLEEQHALAELYLKAVRAAKEKELEYKERIAELVKQTDRDKQLMDFFRNL